MRHYFITSRLFERVGFLTRLDTHFSASLLSALSFDDISGFSREES